MCSQCKSNQIGDARRKWWPSAAESPAASVVSAGFELIDAKFYEEDEDDEDDVDPAATVDGEQPAQNNGAAGSDEVPHRMGVKESNVHVRKIKAGHKNGVEFASWFFVDFQRHRRLDATHHLKQPLVELMKLGLTQTHTIKGHYDFWVDMSAGSLTKALHEMWNAYSSIEYAEKIGFELHVDVPEEKAARDKEVAALSFTLALNYSWQFGLWELEFTSGLPNLFNSLLSHEPGVRDQDYTLNSFPRGEGVVEWQGGIETHVAKIECVDCYLIASFVFLF